jgi:hypothetical protein
VQASVYLLTLWSQDNGAMIAGVLLAGRSPQPTPMLVPVAGTTAHGLMDSPSPDGPNKPSASTTNTHAVGQRSVQAVRPTAIPQRPYMRQQSSRKAPADSAKHATSAPRVGHRQTSNDSASAASGRPSVTFSERTSVRYQPSPSPVCAPAAA